MDWDEIVRSLQQRVPWSVANRILRELDLPRAQGWDRTVDRLIDGNYDSRGNRLALQQALREHIQYGEKLVRFYHLERGENTTAIEALQNARIRRSTFRDAFPGVLVGEDLEDAATSPTLTSIVETDDDVSAVFASVRTMQRREHLSTDDLPDEAGRILRRYDEVIGIQHIKYEAFDVVSISRRSRRAVVMVDYPLGMHRDVADAAHAQVIGEMVDLVGPVLLSGPVNLFPLIDSMYRARHEGAVVELAFGTSTASLKHEKMRRQSLCLREEAYHRGGKAALRTPIEPHHLSIVWSRPLDGGGRTTPELSLHTTAATAAMQNPELFEAEIRKCTGADDFWFVCGRMEEFLSQQDE